MAADPNLPLLESAAAKLGVLRDEVVFIGGATLGLLITDPGAAPIRGTNDVDVIAEIMTITDYLVFSERLRRANFIEDMGEHPLLCRWHNEGLILDVLPLTENVLGYTNIWYAGALRAAVPFLLPSGITVRVISAPFFLGTKMEAFRGRGDGDFFASHDLEDFVAVIDGHPAITDEITGSLAELRQYLARAVAGLLQEERFLDALPGYVMGDEERVPLILGKLRAISQMI